jgi:hypothetical protein
MFKNLIVLALLPLVGTMGLIFSGPIILCWQALFWLKNGHWYPISLTTAFTYMQWDYPYTQWQGVQQIIDYFFDLPLSAITSISGILLFAGGLMFVDSLDQTRKKPNSLRDPSR